jgi:hypothetical protein
VEEPSFVSFDEVGSIFAGEPYDDENKDPYPEFCWMSKRMRKCVMDEKAADNDVEVVDGDVETTLDDLFDVCEEKTDLHPKRRCRFFKRFIMKLKMTFARRAKRRNTVGYQDSFYTLPPTPDISSFASSYCTHS